MRRYVCVWFPEWALDRRYRAGLQERRPPPHRPSHSRRMGSGGAPEGNKALPLTEADRPFVLTQSGSRGLLVTASSPAARLAGIHPGMGFTDACARCPGLASQPASPQEDGEALERLALWMLRIAPCVAREGADGLLLDTTGCDRVFGDEAGLMQTARNALDRASLTHRMAMAPTPGAAWALAHEGPDGVRMDEADLAAGLAVLPVSGLRLTQEALTLLRRFGLNRIGQLYGLERTALARRFSSREVAGAVITRLDQALGLRSEPLIPVIPPAEHTAWLPCPDLLLTPEGVAAGLDLLLGDLCARLARQDLGAQDFIFRAFGADGHHDSVRVRTALPVREPVHLRRLFAERLARIDPGFGLDGLSLEARDTAPMARRPQVLPQTRPASGPNEEALGALVDRLNMRLGEGAASMALPVASHLPERAVRRVPYADASARRAWQDAPATPPRPLLVLDPAESVVVMAEVPDGPPLRFSWRGVVRRVVRATGAERIAPEWWTHWPGEGALGTLPRTRDFYRVEDAEGLGYWLAREGLYDDGRGGPPAWRLYGLFA